MCPRPILHIPLKPVDWIIEGITLSIVIGIVVYTAIHYSTLPHTIPTHYGFSGKADGYGGKSTLLVLLGVLMAMYLALQMMRIVKLIVVIIFSYIILTTIQIAQGKVMSLGTWFIPTVLFFLFVAIITYAVKSSIK